MENYLVLVDEKDQQWGKLEKDLVHRLGLLHRAFSVFIFNSTGELMMQQRADGKYHSGGLWTNTCCSHPQFGEELLPAINRRLYEEMGMKCKTEFAFSFIYKAKFKNGLTEHEYDHVYFGISDESPVPEKSEVKNWCFKSLDMLEKEILNEPDKYTQWLKICMPEVKKYFHESFKHKFTQYA